MLTLFPTLKLLLGHSLACIILTLSAAARASACCQEFTADRPKDYERSDAETFARVLLEGNAESIAQLTSFYCKYQVFRSTKPSGFVVSNDPRAERCDAICDGMWLYTDEKEFLQLDSVQRSPQIPEDGGVEGLVCTNNYWTSVYLRFRELEGIYVPEMETLNLFSSKAKYLRRELTNPLSMWSDTDGTLFPKTRRLERVLDRVSEPRLVSISRGEPGLPVDLQTVDITLLRKKMKVRYGFDTNAGFFLRWYRFDSKGFFVETFVNEVCQIKDGCWFPMKISRISGNPESATLVFDQIVVTEVISDVNWELAETEIDAGTYYFEPGAGRSNNYRVLASPEVIRPGDLGEWLKRTMAPKKTASSMRSGSRTLSISHWLAIGIFNLVFLSVVVFSWRRMMANPLFSSRSKSHLQE